MSVQDALHFLARLGFRVRPIGTSPRADSARPRMRRPALGSRLQVESLEDRRLLAASLVLDLNAGGSSAPAGFAALNGITLFSADDGLNGRELWRTDATAGGTFLLKDIYTGQTFDGLAYVKNSSNPVNLMAAGGNFFFAANDGTNGLELWKSDGTSAGTVLLKDISSGAGNSTPANLTDVNGTLFFTASDGTNGLELWKSDGTAAGTVLVKDIRSGTTGSGAANLTNVNGTLYFTADDGISGVELWKSDGTSAGTAIVTNIKLFAGGSNPGSLVNVNGTLFMAADDGVNGTELWKSNGTSAGTVLVKDIRTGSAGSSPVELVNVNGTLYLVANDGTNGTEIWKSDGTAAGTVLVRNLHTTAGTGSNPANLINVDGTLFFRANDGVLGNELYKSDGTSAGTVLVKDIRTGALGSDPSALVDGNGTLFFTADDGTNGVELWQSDGTLAGTVLDTDLRAGASGSNPVGLTKAGSKLVFQANNGTSGLELFTATLPNAKPVSVAEGYVFELNTARVVAAAAGVLINDTDAEGNALTASLVTGPTSGGLVLNADGSFTYTPNANFNGRDSFTYKAHDGTSLSKTAATVTLTSRTFQFVENLYVETLGRTVANVTAAEVNFWVGLIATGSTRADVVAAIIASDEYRGNLVSGYYTTYLGRAAEAAALSAWVTAMRNGLSANGVLAAILSSTEYYRQTTTDAGLISNLYSDLLGRTASAPENGFWRSLLINGVPRQSVVNGILSSSEFLSIQINSLYTRYLNRAVDAGGLSFWMARQSAGGSLTEVEAALAGSDEFFNL